jgi:tRNA1(Val) A37 N6-methylase TrmN6
MPVQYTDRSHESIINDALATLFRDKAGLKASAETIHPGVRPDIVVRTADGPVIVEVELEPARTLEADALSRLGMEIDGLKVQIAFAVAIPEMIRTVPQEHLQSRLASLNMRWREWRADGTSGPKIVDSFTSLARSVQQAVAPASDLDEAVATLDEGARRAGAHLYRSPGTLARVASVFGSPPGDEPANMGALIIINAMVFQERLANINPDVHPIEMTRDHEHISKIQLTRSWDIILGIDYWPIFKMARDVVSNLSDVEASLVLDECARTAEKLLSMATVGRHDLAGRIFNRLVSDRKFLAAFYTSIPAATLLAGLALSTDAWPEINWADINQLQNFRIIDPCCGTGTLLMASYRQIIDNHCLAVGGLVSVDDLHKALIEQIICGADVIQAAIHVTAATLAAMSPAIKFSQMNLHTLKLGLDQSGKVSLGSLDWLVAPQLQSFFSTTSEQIGAQNGITGMLIPRPLVDLVISNPPYTRRGSDSGHKEAIARIFSISEGDKKAQEKIAKRTSELLRGSAANQMAGHASSFTVLADRLVKPGGRIALVLPITALAGDSWSEVRAMLSLRYNIEFVVSSHDPKLRSMSYDTDIAEVLLVARRLKDGESSTKRGTFVNLWRAPLQVTDALALVNGVTATAQGALHRSDGPPVGGVPLIIGGEPWGELVDAPVSSLPWSGARWKRAVVAQYVSALRRGEFWSSDGTHLQSKIKMKRLGDIFSIGPSHRQIRGDLGPFEAYHGLDSMTQFPALWSQEESQQKSLEVVSNAYLVPKPGQNYLKVWAASGRLHFNPDIRYNSQRVNAVRTTVRALGLSAWFTMNMIRADSETSKREIACLLWTNSTLGLILHADSTQQAQQGRGRGSSEMLESLLIPDVINFEAWQLEAAEAIWRDFSNREFESFHKCAIDPSRIELDERVITQMLGLPDDVKQTAKRLRYLLANEPSIYGGKDPILPVDE